MAASPHAPHRGTDYSTYLHIDDLLRLQQPLTPAAHDELLFIVSHQAYELWFKLLLHELAAARDQLLQGSPQAAVAPLQRVVSIWRVLLEQVGVLETMSPVGFLDFRDPLAPASGFESVQFREIEMLSGLPDQGQAARMAASPAERERLERRRWEPPLPAAFAAACRSAGIDVPDGDDDPVRERRLTALTTLYRQHHTDLRWTVLHIVAELLLDHDEAIARWRHHHALMAAREIGARPGTGGSLGVAYLQSTLDRRGFPDLWELRTRL